MVAVGEGVIENSGYGFCRGSTGGTGGTGGMRCLECYNRDS